MGRYQVHKKMRKGLVKKDDDSGLQKIEMLHIACRKSHILDTCDNLDILDNWREISTSSKNITGDKSGDTIAINGLMYLRLIWKRLGQWVDRATKGLFKAISTCGKRRNSNT